MNELNNTTLLVSYLFIILLTLFFGIRKLGLTKDILLSSIQGIIQLTLAGLCVLWLFRHDNALLLLGMVLFMCVFASYLTSRRWKKFKGMWGLITTTIFLTTFLNLGLILLIKVATWKTQYIIPIAGIIIGQIMNNCSFFIDRITSDLEQAKTLVEANLSLGASSQVAIQPFANQAIITCSMPMIDTFKTLGVVYLPGTMAGLILGGVDPLDAVKYQLIIIFMLTFAFGFSSLFLAKFIHLVLFNKDHQRV